MSLEIIETTNYDQFKILEKNRSVESNRIDELCLSIKNSNKLRINPIIVNKEFFVIDGQHRLQAAKHLKIPIYYIVDEESNDNDIIYMNTNRKNWTMNNYLHYHYTSGNETYMFINDLSLYCKSFNTSFNLIIQPIESLSNKKYGNIHVSFRMGKIILTKDEKEEIQTFCKETYPIVKEINHLVKRNNKKCAASLFFKTQYLRSLILCFQNLTPKQYKELLDCLFRDHARIPDINGVLNVLDVFQNSYNYKKSTTKLKFNFSFNSEDN